MIATLMFFAALLNPVLSPEEKYSHASLTLASAYAQCRNQGVGGVWLEGTDIRAEVAAMIADRKLKCRSERKQLRKSMLSDLGGKKHTEEVDGLLQKFDAAIDESIASRIAVD